MFYSYSIFGLKVRSSHLLPFLAEIQDGGADLEVAFTHEPGVRGAIESNFYTSENLAEGDRPAVTASAPADRSYLALTYADGTRFVILPGEGRVVAHSPANATLEDTCTYLLGPVMGYILRLRGVTCLHASVVEIEEGAVAFVGPAGAGKSTLAAAFTDAGHAVLSDDLAALVPDRGGFRVPSGYAGLRLWPESVRALYRHEDALPRLTPTWEKRFRPLENDKEFAARSLPLAAVYLLGERRPGEHRMVRVAGAEAVVRLVANSTVNYLLDGPMRAAELADLGKVVAAVPVRAVHPSDEIAKVRELAAAIRDDVRTASGVVRG